MKTCPFCAEEIQDAAIVCKHCGRDLPKVEQKLDEEITPKKSVELSKTSMTLTIIIVIAMIFLCVIVIQSIDSNGGESGSNTNIDSGSSIRRVKYLISGTTNSASITLSNSDGGTEQMDVPVPWEKTYSMYRGDFAYVSGQNNRDHGTISCHILVDGDIFKEAESSGAYVIASCSGSIP